MARRSRRNNAEENSLDLTPMMDIVFIMLIFFIVTTSFVKETGVEISRPNAETAERDERGNGDVTSVEVESEKATQEQTECVRSVPDASLTAERHTNEDAETPSLSEDQEAIGGRSAEGFSDATSPKSEIDEASIAADQKIIKNQGDHGEGANFQNDTNCKDSSPSGTTTEKATESTTTESSRQDSSTVFEQVQRDASEKHEP